MCFYGQRNRCGHILMSQEGEGIKVGEVVKGREARLICTTNDTESRRETVDVISEAALFTYSFIIQSNVSVPLTVNRGLHLSLSVS